MSIKSVEVKVEPRIRSIEVGGGMPGPAGPAGNNGADGVSVVSAAIDGSYHLILTLSNGGTVDAGYVRGPQGAQGIQGIQGVSVVSAAIDGSYHLILTLSTGGTIDAGYVRGSQGAQGIQGVSITGASIDGSFHLILTLSTGGTIDAGYVRGSQGAQGIQGNPGTDGTDGDDGVSITGASIDGSFHLILTLSTGGTIDAGYVRGPAGADGTGTGDVVGPASAVNDNFAAFNTTTGKLIKDSGKSSASFATAAQGMLADSAVQGPNSAVNNNFAAFNGTTGKLINDSGKSSASFATAAQGVLADGSIQGPGAVTSGNPVVFSGTTGKAVVQVDFATFKTSLALTKSDVGLSNVDNTSDATKWAATKTLTNTTFDAAGTGNVLSNIALTMFAAGVIDTSGTLAANSDSKLATQKAVKTYADALIAAQDAMVFKGVIDCSTNPNYPAADRGWTYRVSVAGKIGGASGPNVEAGDLLLCLTDGTASGNQATVGANWSIIQTNLDGAVIGPASAADASVAGYNGTTGKVIKQLTAAEIRAAATLATTDSPQFAAVNVGNAADTTVTRVSAGVIAVEGVNVLMTSNIGVSGGVQAWDADLNTWATKTAPAGTVVGDTDAQTLSSKTLAGPTINNAITVESYAFNTSTNAAVDLANGTLQIPTLTGNWVPGAGWPAVTAGQGFRMIVKTGAGSFGITWPSSVKWNAGTAPTLTVTASRADIIDFESDGTNWYGYVVGLAYVP